MKENMKGKWEVMWDGTFHSEIELATNISFEQKKNLQYMLEVDFNGNFSEMMKDMLKYAVDVEEYESAAEIRDYLEE